MKIGVVGAGQFSPSFIPLFQAHPYVSEVYLAELIPERLDRIAKRLGITKTFASFDELIKSDVDAVAIFTQRHLHGPQALAALEHGKHVYCAVPISHRLEEIDAIVEKVKQTGLTYMTGETSYYYPCTVYCRERFRRGDFGEFVFGEAQYYHDMSHGFYDAFKYSGGADWKQVAGFPPMFYPTHSTSMILSVTGARIKKASCLGYTDHDEDGIFKTGGNLWDNPFSNESALMRTSDGGSCRINEFRRVGWISKIDSVYMSMFGSKGSFEQHANGSVWTSLQAHEITDLTAKLACRPRTKPVKQEESAGLSQALVSDFFGGMCEIHPVYRLPESFRGMHSGHSGSHQFLADDFVKAVHFGKLPPNHVWAAAKYAAPGIIAHQSAEQDGVLLDVPDFGEPPVGLSMLDPDTVQI